MSTAGIAYSVQGAARFEHGRLALQVPPQLLRKQQGEAVHDRPPRLGLRLKEARVHERAHVLAQAVTCRSQNMPWPGEHGLMHAGNVPRLRSSRRITHDCWEALASDVCPAQVGREVIAPGREVFTNHLEVRPQRFGRAKNGGRKACCNHAERRCAETLRCHCVHMLAQQLDKYIRRRTKKGNFVETRERDGLQKGIPASQHLHACDM